MRNTTRSKADGGLRALFHAKLADRAQWTAIETGETSPGVADSAFVFDGGYEGWIEFKTTNGWAVTFQPMQPAWLNQRARLGGNVWIAIRRKSNELWIFNGFWAPLIAMRGLRDMRGAAITVFEDSWNWGEIREILCGKRKER
jgi:hypothetical protein